VPTDGVPAGPQWVYEIKHDGFRFICRRDRERVRVFSRRGHDWNDRVPLIAQALAALGVKSVTLDGEGVACGPDGVSDFDRMRAAVGRKGSRDARRKVLARLLRGAGPGIRHSDHMGGDGATVFAHACKLGLEGIIAKRRDRPYRSGRSPDWSRSRTRMHQRRPG
jgi:bifunctional non-homologous end joining protein LigD